MAVVPKACIEARCHHSIDLYGCKEICEARFEDDAVLQLIVGSATLGHSGEDTGIQGPSIAVAGCTCTCACRKVEIEGRAGREEGRRGRKGQRRTKSHNRYDVAHFCEGMRSGATAEVGKGW